MPTAAHTIYLDHNSTTPILPEALAAMVECQQSVYGNPESQHQLGRQARHVLEEAREGIAALLGAAAAGRQPDRLIFTSGGTEANNLALFGMAGSAATGTLVVSAIEHPSVARPAEALARRGWHIERIGVSSAGVVELEQFAAALVKADPALKQSTGQSSISKRPRFASVMLANNETGVLQPIEQLAELGRAAKVLLHTDAAQTVGKVPVDFRRLGVAALSCAAHKFHGPRGIGALLLRGDVPLEPLHWGGFQQYGLRPGTESVALAVGMHVALACFQREQLDRVARIARLRDRFEGAIRSNWPTATIHGISEDGNEATVQRLPGTSNISFPGYDRQALQMALDLAGVACSTGSACASGSREPSPTLTAMGLPESQVQSSLRFSLGATTTEADIALAAERILSVLRAAKPRE
ncbi:MAG TPA: cysteine desulfurase family protein [Pirellulales bacterium]|jgi:cysteine desulfurase|nr:cysteine desulfurase family protein [Pirellulales bacterium]